MRQKQHDETAKVSCGDGSTGTLQRRAGHPRPQCGPSWRRAPARMGLSRRTARASAIPSAARCGSIGARAPAVAGPSSGRGSVRSAWHPEAAPGAGRAACAWPRHRLLDGADRRPVPIRDHLVRRDAAPIGHQDQGGPGAGAIVVRAQQHVDDLVGPIDRVVSVHPLPADAHVDFVAPPATAKAGERPTPRSARRSCPSATERRTCRYHRTAATMILPRQAVPGERGGRPRDVGATARGQR